MNKRYFSMVELVMLIVLLVVLLALWLPTMFSWRGKAREVSCSGNLKQCVNALLAYGDNNDDFLCTYGNEYSGWYRQPGVAEELGIKLSKAGRSPITERPVTLCPDSWISAGGGMNSAQAYGAAWFIPMPNDYAESGCEIVAPTKTNPGQFIATSKIPIPADFVLLADSAYTRGENKGDEVTGIQCILFARRCEGALSYFPRAIALRHQNEANVGYADGHVGTTMDRMGMLIKSKIGAFVDPTGRNYIITTNSY